MSRTALYRHYDVNDRLLYVGIASYMPSRTAQHRANSPWFVDVARTSVEWLETREHAAALELVAIQFEKPIHNLAGLAKADTNAPDTDLRAAVKKDGRTWRAISLASGLGPNFLQQVFTSGKDPSLGNVAKVMAALRNQSDLNEVAQ